MKSKITFFPQGKKGLGVGQVFIFIIVVLTFGLIMVFGYKAISDFLEGGEEVAFVQFKNDLESSIKTIYTEYGSVREKTFRPPAKYTQICFIDLDYGDIAFAKEDLCDENIVACSVWEDALEAQRSSGDPGVGYKSVDINVFLTPDAPSIKVHNIELFDENGVETGAYCFKITRGIFSLRMEGKGSHTKISPVPLEE
jgi:hypothetical protein